ncbi:Uncharacterised protein [Helicobacter canis]|uniref:Inner membrane protein n=1 Tax=Helicobacter canis TaxID=29419 RepID=A0A377J4S1_9HELI|nr:Uncharacterised protein [Helicobacter canis]
MKWFALEWLALAAIATLYLLQLSLCLYLCVQGYPCIQEWRMPQSFMEGLGLFVIIANILVSPIYLVLIIGYIERIWQKIG